jgi:hypothetical protein
MPVSSMGGDMRTQHICPVVSVTIRGVYFLANVIIMDSNGIEIMLGMYWLKKYDGVILCAKRVVRLTTEHGTTMEFSTVMTTDQDSMLNHVHGNSLVEIRVVQEYLEVQQVTTTSSSSLIWYREHPLFPRDPLGCQ